MTALFAPTRSLHAQRNGLRQKQVSHSRPRLAGPLAGHGEGAGGATSECVVKRFPAIGDTAGQDKQRW